MRIPVLTAAHGAAWEAELLVALDREGHAVVVARRCVDVVELLAVAATGQGRAALVAADLPRLDRAAVDRLVAAEVVPVGVVPRGDHAALERLRSVGIEVTVPADADAAVVSAVVEQALADTTADGSGRRRADRTFGDPAAATSGRVRPDDPDDPTDPAAAADAAPGPDPERRGVVVAVWGPTGAPGRTTVAVTLADELARLGLHTLLIDADVYGGVVAAVLGLLDDSPGLAAACRADGAGRLDPDVLAGLAWGVTDRLRVLTGLPRADRWPELRPASVTGVLTTARALADITVVDLGFGLEQDEELSFDTAAPRRNGATLAVLDASDVVLAVGAADPVGVQRLVRGLSELGDSGVTAPVWVVINKVRAGAVPGDPRAEIAAALTRFAGRAPVAFLPADTAGLDAALAVGRTLGEVRPESPLRRAVAELAATVSGVPGAGGRRRAGRRRGGRRRAG